MVLQDKKLIIVAIIAGVIGLGAIIRFIGQGNVRYVEIFWKEKVEQTVAFEDVNGEVQLKGISGELNLI
jgi:hypothetical protein